MKKDEEKVNFDLSVLSLQELISTYQNVVDFIKFLDEKKIVIEEKVKDQDE